MRRRKAVTAVILALIAIVAAASAALYFVYAPEKPWMAFLVAFCGGAFILNLLFSLFFVRKNFKN